MQLSDNDVAIIRGWAAAEECVREVYLFGSRARETAKPDSDLDIAIVLDTSDADPPSAGSCFGLYFGKGDTWQRELTERLGRHVSLEALGGSDEERLAAKITSEGVKLWP